MHKYKQTKRILAILLTLALCLGGSNLPVSAAEQPVEPEYVQVTLSVPEAVTAEVWDEAGEVVAASEENVYQLTEGAAYTYHTTKDTYYHAAGAFTAEDALVVQTAEPLTEDALDEAALYDAAGAEARTPYQGETEYTKEQHSRCYYVTDENSSAAVQATPSEGYTVQARYNRQSVQASKHGTEVVRSIKKTVGTGGAVFLPDAVASCGYGQQITLRLCKEEQGITYYQDYELQLKRTLHLSALSVLNAGKEVTLLDENQTETRFDPKITEYYAAVTPETETLTVKPALMNDQTETEICGGYTLSVNGELCDRTEEILLPLTGDMEQTVELTVGHQDESSQPAVYRLHIIRQGLVEVYFHTVPSEAVVAVYHARTNTRIYSEPDGGFAVVPGEAYRYTVNCSGYVGAQVTDYVAPQESTVLTTELQRAPENTAIDTAITSEWSSFRHSQDNNGVINARTPLEPEKTVLYWATKLGEGYGSKATGCPILAGGYLYTYAGKTLYKIDTVNGAIVAQAEMADASSFAINPPTYAKGMLFVGLSNGKVQAFNAKTLESLWLYQDKLGGQPNCSIHYENGYIYTGFWKGETQEANYVCLSVTDEDPSQDMERKLPVWSYTRKGGFYWAGAYVCGSYMLVGTDDGESGYMTGYGHVLSFNPKTGELLDDIKMPNTGDVRSDITKYKDSYYFTSKGGYFYEVKVNEDGSFRKDSLRYMKLENGAQDDAHPAMSTSTPTIYNDRAYVGVSGTSQFGAYSGHNITVIDLEKWKIAYSVPTQGYPQTSGLLTTSYEKETGAVYLYFIDNYTPGKLRVLSDCKGQTEAVEYTVEEYRENGEKKSCKTAKVLFTPTGEQAQYAICSPIVDEYGTIYFKNDSAYLMAVGNIIEKLVVTKQPDKTTYLIGEVFNATGMKVSAVYGNGKTRDVTKYISYAKTPLTKDDRDLMLRFECVLYQNKNGKTGVKAKKPVGSVSLKVTEPSTGDNTKQKVTAALSSKKYTYNGKQKTPKVTVKTTGGKTLKRGRDYTVTYDKGRKNVGRYAVRLQYKGAYSGEKVLYFTILPKAPVVKRLKAGTGSFTVYWKKQTKQTDGYQLQYAANIDMKHAKRLTVKKGAKTKRVRGLKGKRTYYVRLRAYKTVRQNGKKKKIYSVWSSVKAVTINKK